MALICRTTQLGWILSVILHIYIWLSSNLGLFHIGVQQMFTCSLIFVWVIMYLQLLTKLFYAQLNSWKEYVGNSNMLLFYELQILILGCFTIFLSFIWRISLFLLLIRKFTIGRVLTITAVAKQKHIKDTT